MAGQQMLLLQQQVTMLTQLLQQSQQQNAALASQVQQMTQELSGIKQQLQQAPATAKAGFYQQLQPESYAALDRDEMQLECEQQAAAAAAVQDGAAAVQDSAVIEQNSAPAAATVVAVPTGTPGVSSEEQDSSAAASSSSAPADAAPAAGASAAAQQMQGSSAADSLPAPAPAPPPVPDHAVHDAAAAEQLAAASAALAAQAMQQPVTAVDAPEATSSSAAANISKGSSSSRDAAPVPLDAAVTAAAGSGSDSDAEAEGKEPGTQQLLRPLDDAFVGAVYRCRSWQQLRTVVEESQLKRQQLQPWQLLAALRQLSGTINSGAAAAAAATAGSSNSQRQHQIAQQLEDFGASLVQRLLQHPGLWSPAAPGLRCALYPHESKALLLAVAGLALKLPASSCSEQLQALYEDAVQHGIPAEQQQQQQANSEASWVLSADQQVQLLGGCLTLGLKPLQQHLQLLDTLPPAIVANFSLLGAALLLFTADALLANRMLGNPAAAARAAGSLPPSQVGIGEVHLSLLAAALQRLAAAKSWQLNRQLGARRIRQLLLLPLSRLAPHRHLQLTVAMQQQHKQQQQNPQQQQVEDPELQECDGGYNSSGSDNESNEAFTSSMPGLVHDVCIAVQRAISDGLYAQHQKQQQQQQQPAVRGGRSSSSSNNASRRPSRSSAAGRPAPTGGWSVVPAAAALLLMSNQLGCPITPRCLPVFTAAAGAQLSSLPDLLAPLVQLVTASAAAGEAAAAATSSPDNGQQLAADGFEKQQQQRRGYGRWRSAVLDYLGSVSSRLPVDAVLGTVVALAQHHAQEEAQQDSSSSGVGVGIDSSSTFSQECNKIVEASVERTVQAAERLIQQQQQQRKQQQQLLLLPYSSQQLALLLGQLQQAGLSPSSSTASGLLQLILMGPQLQQAAAAGRAGGLQQQQQGCITGPALAQAADLAAAYTAASQLRNQPDQRLMQQLAAAVHQAGQPAAAAGKATWSSAASSSQTAAGATFMSASEACALICSLGPSPADDSIIADATAAPSSSSSIDRAKLGDYAFAVYQGIGQLQGSQLAALLAGLAALRVPLADPLGPRALDGKANVTYGMVLAAAASAAAAPAMLAATPPDAVAQLAAGVAGLGGRPDAGWWGAVQQRLAGQLGDVGGGRLQQLLGALLACNVRPGQEWLQEACQVSSQ
jgi:hypothetical protein